MPDSTTDSYSHPSLNANTTYYPNSKSTEISETYSHLSRPHFVNAVTDILRFVSMRYF